MATAQHPVLRIVVFVFLIPALLAAAIPWWLVRLLPMRSSILAQSPTWFGLIVLGVGVAFYLWSAWALIARGRGNPAPVHHERELIAVGPYLITRNPMYVGLLTIVLGEALWLQSRAVFWYALLLFIAFHGIILFIEEPVLQRRFGSSFQQYQARVPRWLQWRK